MIWIWIGFITLILVLLALDLGVFHRKAHAVSVKEALIWSVVWITTAMVFNIFVYFAYEHHWQGLGLVPSLMHPTGLAGHSATVLFFTGYVIEKSLSVDNLFVIALIFTYFRIPSVYQHRVLFWGILGALIMRGGMIWLGTTLIERFHWILYVFGVFLILTAFKMLFGNSEPDPKKNVLMKLAAKVFPISHELDGQRFLSRIGGRFMLTPLATTLIVVESTDVVFAVDSIPAIFAITTDPFLVFTSNVFAILGLRALYFALAGILDKFYYLKLSLAVVLAVVGVKMLAANWLKRNDWLRDNMSFVTLGLVAVILAAGIIASIIRARRMPLEPDDAPAT
ncbi:MAG: TerC family protein [Planctomycetota bacterium]|nr:TerC family protein [Planctomycetota bacterium]